MRRLSRADRLIWSVWKLFVRLLSVRNVSLDLKNSKMRACFSTFWATLIFETTPWKWTNTRFGLTYVKTRKKEIRKNFPAKNTRFGLAYVWNPSTFFFQIIFFSENFFPKFLVLSDVKLICGRISCMFFFLATPIKYYDVCFTWIQNWNSTFTHSPWTTDCQQKNLLTSDTII